MLDLRSDTVTLPTEAMRAAMAQAPVGDDVFEEDPSVNLLQERAAEITGKPAGLFTASGTMANLLAIMTHARPADSVILGENAHSWLYEAGAIAAIAGVLPIVVGKGGTFRWSDVEKNAKGANIHYAPTSLVMMENTMNAGGGIVFPQKDIIEIGGKSRFWGFKVHIDGARIFNASIATGKSVRELAAPADSICFCLSKGLGAPVGSVLCGEKDFILRARRNRKMLGGGMRQAGIIAAAGIYALDHHVERLKDDHDNARLLAEKLAAIPGLQIDLARVQTNMVYVEVAREGLTAFEYSARLKSQGLLVIPVSPTAIRAVTHLGIEKADIDKAAAIFAEALKG